MKRAKFLLPTLLILLLSSVCNKSPTGPDGVDKLPQWPMFGGNLRNTSNVADPMEYYPGPQAGQVVWQWKTSETFFCSPSVGDDGTIYVATSLCDCVAADSGFIYAFASDGSMKWRFKTRNSNFSRGALANDGTYFYGSLDGFFYAINSDGKLRWKRMLGSGAFEAQESVPALTRFGEVIVASDSGIVALDIATGETVWRYPAKTTIGYGVSIDSDNNIYTGTNNSLISLDRDGTLRWEFASVRFGPRDVVIADGDAVYFNLGSDNKLYALNPDGSLHWTFSFEGRTGLNRPGLGVDGSIYFVVPATGLLRSRLYKVTPDGKLAWYIQLSTLLAGNPSYVDVGNSVPLIDKDGNIYLTMSGTFGDNLFSINQNREVNWSLFITDKILFSKPAIAPDGTLYIGGGGALRAIR